MAYQKLKNHSGRGAARSAAPSQRNRAPANRNAAPLRHTYGGRTSIPRTAASVQRSTARAVQNAIPRGRYAVGAAAGAAAANALVHDQLAQINDAVQTAEEWLRMGDYQVPQQGLNPGLNYIGILKGPQFGVGTGGFVSPTSKPFVWNTGLGGLGITFLSGATNPNTYASYGWGGASAVSVVPNLRYLGTFQVPETWYYSSYQRRYQREIYVYRNLTGQDQPVMVDTPPYVAPWGNPAPELHPTIAPAPQARPLPLPRPRPEVTIDVTPETVRVYEPAPQKPPPGVKERKGASASSAAAAAFWAFELADDIKDWVNIAIAANSRVPYLVRRGNTLTKLGWLMENPETLITDTDWLGVATALGQWLIDEAIGAAMGAAQRSAAERLGASGRPFNFGFGAVSAWQNTFGGGIPAVRRGASSPY